MTCLKHIDRAVMVGAVATAASAAVLFASLGLDRGPLVPPEPITSALFLEQEMEKAIKEAVATSARVMHQQERAQAALGRAIITLEAAKEWGGASMLNPETMPAPHALTQADLGRLIVVGSQVQEAALQRAEARYGLAVRDATVADWRAVGEPAASRATMVAAAQVMTGLAERTKPGAEPIIMRDPGWGFGSIGDGMVVPLMILGVGMMGLFVAGVGMMTEHGASIRTAAAHCDTHDNDVVIEALVSDETLYEVIHCSAFNGGPVTCDKHCLQWPLAHAV